MERSLYEMLKAQYRQKPCRMHMPGHKQKREEDPLWEGIFSLDVTEIGEFDDLHAPEGILKRSMERAAKVWGAEESFYLVGSSTAGILAGIAAVLKTPGQRVLLARNCHKSVYHACEWMQAKTRFVMPPWDQEAGMFSSLPPHLVEEALQQDSEIALVVITSPTYEGVISDVKEIARICHRRGVPLMVDEAHGAHLGLWGVFADSAVAAGADLVVQSLHKTLPSLTQTGILHCRWDRVERGEVKRRLQMVQSSSPSYVLMASIDRCVRWLSQGRAEVWEQWNSRCLALRKEINAFHRFAVAQPQRGVFALDPTKIPVQDRSGVLSGKRLEQLLGQRGVLCEMSLGPNALLYTGAWTDDEDCRRVLSALRDTQGLPPWEKSDDAPLPAPPCNDSLMDVTEALARDKEERDYACLEGAVSAEYLWAYPPGIPIVCPGERISKETAEYVLRLEKEGCRLLCGGECSRGRLKVLKNAEK